MEGFDQMQLPYLASPMTLDSMNTGDYLGSLPVGAGLFGTEDFGSG